MGVAGAGKSYNFFLQMHELHSGFFFQSGTVGFIAQRILIK